MLNCVEFIDFRKKKPAAMAYLERSWHLLLLFPEFTDWREILHRTSAAIGNGPGLNHRDHVLYLPSTHHVFLYGISFSASPSPPITSSRSPPISPPHPLHMEKPSNQRRLSRPPPSEAACPPDNLFLGRLGLVLETGRKPDSELPSAR